MAPPEPGLDPRLATPEAGVRPVVALPRAGLPTWLLVAFAAVAAILLFAVLNSRRQAGVETEITANAAETAVYAPPPPLYTPPPPAPENQYVVAAAGQPQPKTAAQGPYVLREQAPPAQPLRGGGAAPRQSASFPSDAPSSPPVIYVPQQDTTGFQSTPQPREDSGSALVVDTTSLGGSEAGAGAAPEGGTITAAGTGGRTAPQGPGTSLGARARAGTLANRSVTVPQGTLIPAVIETAFNSDRGGFARAMVSRDVRGFDGSRVLIPRGSRLIGEYRSDVAPGQRRALVNWVRLVRPDGVTMTIASPSTDTLGRAGMDARVNTHFFRRFGSALLRSVIDLGASYATVRARGSPVVLLPGSSQSSGGGGDAEIRPTLTVPAGRSISVFVTRDLDFSGAGGRN